MTRMKHLLAGLLIVASASPALSQGPAADPAADAAAGRMLFRDTPLLRGSINACIQCHANPAAQRRGVTLADQQDHIRWAIQGGCGGAQLAVYPLGAMAQFQTLLDTDDIRRLASYIREPAVAAAWPRLQPRTAQAGSVAIGNRSVLSLTLDNAGELPLTIRAVTVEGRDAAEFVPQSSGCAATGVLVPGGACTVELDFAPSCAAPRQAVALVHHDGPLSPSRVVAQGEGSGPAVPQLGVAPAQLDFGAAGAGSVTAELTVSNRCAGQLVLGAIGLEGPFERDTAAGACAPGRVLGPAEACRIVVRRAAGQFGPASGALTVAHSASATALQVPLAAVALDGPALEAEAASVTIAGATTVGESRSFVATNVVNRGARPATLLAFTSDSPEFAISTAGSGTCAVGATLAPGVGCALALRFEPLQAGSRRAVLSVAYSDGTPGAAPASLAVEVVAQGNAASVADPPPAGGASGGGAAGMLGAALLGLCGFARRRRR